METKAGIPVNVNISIDYKSAAILAGVLFISAVAALLIYKHG